MPSTDITGIQSKLAARQSRRTLVCVAGFIFGFPLLFFGPLMLGSIFWFSCGMLYEWYPWSWFFWGSSAVIIPILFFTEYRAAGNFMSEAISAEEAKRAETGQTIVGLGSLINPRMHSTLALAAALAAPRASMAGFIELFLFGPRLILGAVQTARMLTRLRGVDMERTALLLHQLLKANIGTPISRLVRSPEEIFDLALPLAYLVFYDWAGLAADQSKAWILTDAKAELKGTQ